MSKMEAVTLPDVEGTTQAGVSSWPRWLLILTLVTALAVLFGLYMGLGYAGTDLAQGDIQRIFYIHMPSFFGAFFAFGAGVVGGIQYLRTRAIKWDTLALAGIEVGMALAVVNLVTGTDLVTSDLEYLVDAGPRLTSEAIMVLAYAAYLMLRAGIENPEQRRRFASVYGILAMSTVIITLVIIRIRPDTIHPAVIGSSPQNAEGGFELAATAGVSAALMVNLPIWFILVPLTLIWHRIRLQNLWEHIQIKKLEILSQ